MIVGAHISNRLNQRLWYCRKKSQNLHLQKKIQTQTQSLAIRNLVIKNSRSFTLSVKLMWGKA